MPTVHELPDTEHEFPGTETLLAKEQSPPT